MMIANDKIHSQRIGICYFVHGFDSAVQGYHKRTTLLFGSVNAFGGNTVSFRVTVRDIIDKIICLGTQK